MKNIIIFLSVLICKLALADDSNVLEVSLLKNDKIVESQLCDKSNCVLSNYKVKDYLIGISSNSNIVISDKEIEEERFEIKEIKEKKDGGGSVLEVTYNDKIKKGYFNKNDELEIFFSMMRKSEVSNFEKRIYIPITNVNAYNIKIDEDTVIKVNYLIN